MRVGSGMICGMLRCWRQSQHLTSSVGNRCPIGVARFSTVSQEELLVQHIQSHNRIFAQPTPDMLPVPDGFPFLVEIFGPSYSDVCLQRVYKQDTIFIEVQKFLHNCPIPALLMNAKISNGLDQFVKFKMYSNPNDVGIHVIRVSNPHSRHVEGSEKYLETRGINPSTVRILCDYMKKRAIPRHEEFPFEIKDGLERGTLTLRRKGEDEIVFVEVRSVEQDRILDELADLEARDYMFETVKHSLDEMELHGIEGDMEMFEDENVVGIDERVEDIGCLFMTVVIYYGPPHYNKLIRLDVFGFPDQIFVPRISLRDREDWGFRGFDTYFKDRGIHTGTTNFMLKFLLGRPPYKRAPTPKVLGRFDESQIQEAIRQAKERIS